MVVDVARPDHAVIIIYYYIVPLAKPKECFSKSLKCDDFRGIAISPIISKLFEYCVLDRFKDYLQVTTDNQFGFKKNVGCSFAIRIVRNNVDSYFVLFVQLIFALLIYQKLLIRLITTHYLLS